MSASHIEHRAGDGPWTIALWCDGRPAVVSGLDRYPVIGDFLEVAGVVWVVVDDRKSYIASRLAG